MAKTNKFVPFEKSGKDKDPKGMKMKEGSKKEEAFDRKQGSAMKNGGKVCAQRG